MISVIVPVSKKDYEEGMMDELFPQLEEAIDNCKEKVQILIVINPPKVGRVKAKNEGARIAAGETLVFLDCDNRISSNFFNEVSEKSKNDYFVGGGVKSLKLSRYSIGIVCYMILLGMFVVVKGITLGSFWVRKDVFMAVGGFKEVKYDDIDFALRLKKYAKRTNRKFESIKKSLLVWSTRKFDKHGDWHWLRGYHVEE